VLIFSYVCEFVTVFKLHETWSLTLREERRLRVFENRVFRRICGPKRDEVTGEWRKLHNEELNDLCSSPSIVWVIKSLSLSLSLWGWMLASRPTLCPFPGLGTSWDSTTETWAGLLVVVTCMKCVAAGLASVLLWSWHCGPDHHTADIVHFA
jgi:hypothetical protein